MGTGSSIPNGKVARVSSKLLSYVMTKVKKDRIYNCAKRLRFNA
jgi:hypothetical protein